MSFIKKTSLEISVEYTSGSEKVILTVGEYRLACENGRQVIIDGASYNGAGRCMLIE